MPGTVSKQLPTSQFFQQMDKRTYSTNSGLNTDSECSRGSVLAGLGFDISHQVFDTSVMKTENVALASGNKE